MTIDLETKSRIHIVGIGGAGMGAIAEVLHGMGHDVSGTDLTTSQTLISLQQLGVDARVGHDPRAVEDADVIVRSTAIPDNNVEVAAAREAGLHVYRRADMLSAIARHRRTVAVAGTHGKTTTSSMLAVASKAAGLDPSYIIGGLIPDLGTGAHWGEADWFVVEADESDGTFLELGHAIGIITNVEADHLEYYGGEAAMREAFVTFAAEGSRAIVCADDPGAMALAQGMHDPARVVTYGTDPGADVRIVDINRSATGTTFSLEGQLGACGPFRIAMPGLHNTRNAVAALVAVAEMGGDLGQAATALDAFGGVGRRFDRRGTKDEIDFVDDYAHLPTEVRAALDAARDLHRDRIVAIFQPHRFSRTQQVWQDFEGAFDAADLLVVTGIYSSGEEPRLGITGQLVVDAVKRGHGHPEVLYIDDRSEVAGLVAQLLQKGDVCLTLGAGDLTQLPDEVMALLGDSA